MKFNLRWYLLRSPQTFKINKIDGATLLSGNDIDVAYNHFLEKVENIINKHLPFDKISKRKLKQQKRKLLVSNDLLKLINFRKKLHKKDKTEKDLNHRNDLINEVKVLQSSIRKKIQFEKDNYYQNFLKEYKNNVI